MGHNPAMDPLPKTYRSEQIAEALRRGIRSGEFAGWLPAERALSRHFHVGRDQVHQAIVQLRAEDWLVSEGGRNRVRRPVRARVRRRSVTVLTPGRLEDADRVFLYLLDQLREGLSASAIDLRIEVHPGLRHPGPGTGLTRLLGQSPDTLWVLHRAPGPVQAWFRARGVAGLILGTGEAECGFPYLDVDQAAAARHAVGRLLRVGHLPGELMFLRPREDLPGLERMAAGLEQGLGHAPRVVRVPASLSGLDRRLAGLDWHGPDAPRAVLTAGSREALFAHGWIPDNTGLRIGRDVSLCCLSDHRDFLALYPPVAHYTMRSRTYARRLLRLTRQLVAGRGSAVPVRNLVVPEAVPGGSIRRAPG